MLKTISTALMLGIMTLIPSYLALSEPLIPSVPLSNEVKLLPDFNVISLFDLGVIEEAGELGEDFNSFADYDLSRIWNVGDTPDMFLKLGDLEDALAPDRFLIGDIFQLSNLLEDFLKLPLSSFPLLNKQTLAELVTAIPDLGELYAFEVEPIELLIQQEFPGLNYRGRKLDLIVMQPNIGNLTLDLLDVSQLDSLTLEQIPNLEHAQLGDFADWKSSFFSEVPGLSQVPLASYPNPVSPNGTFIARADWVWGPYESNRSRTISGSYLEGFSVPCQTNCAHLELDDVENFGQAVNLPFEGSQWISGQYQRVLGGTGCWIGYEPTGIHPFGNTFKMVLWDTTEATDTANVVLFFNVKSQCGESPYFIGPVASPWSNLHNNDFIFIGN